MSLKQKLQANVYSLVNLLTGRLARLEARVMRLEHRLEGQLAIQRAHLVRVKNREQVSDAFLLDGAPYRDLSPREAWALFQKDDYDFAFLDVSHAGFVPARPRPAEMVHIPLEELESRFGEIERRTTPLLVISEDGLRSVLACEFLASKGLHNCNNVSGGWLYWPGHALQAVDGHKVG